MVSEKNQRKAARLKKRIKVEYGSNDIDRLGYSKDISTSGMFLNATKLLRVGERIHMRISWPAGLFYAEGLVVRIVAAHPQLKAVQESGMGVRFYTPEELVDFVVPRALRANTEAFVEYRSEEEVQRIINEQLRHDVLVVPIRDPRPSIEMVVDLKILLAHRRSHNIIPVRGTVIQLSAPDFEAQGNAPYAVIRVDNCGELLRRLAVTEG